MTRDADLRAVPRSAHIGCGLVGAPESRGSLAGLEVVAKVVGSLEGIAVGLVVTQRILVGGLEGLGHLQIALVGGFSRGRMIQIHYIYSLKIITQCINSTKFSTLRVNFGNNSMNNTTNAI